MAIAEANSYATKHGFGYAGLAQSFWMFTEIEVNGVEVFSLMRESDLGAAEYIDTFFDNGHERQREDMKK